MSKRKLPESLGLPPAALNQGDLSPEQEHPAHQMARIVEQMETPPRRTIPKGSPADEFMQGSPAIRDDVSTLTCDLSLIDKDRWNKRRTLSAIVLAVLPIKAKSSTVRRNVVLRDEFTECTVTVWGNHTNILNDTAIGRPVTLQRICLTEFEGKTQIAMPKDSSVALGNTAATAQIMLWLQRVGTAAISVQQVPQLLNLYLIQPCLNTSAGHRNRSVDSDLCAWNTGQSGVRNRRHERWLATPIDHHHYCKWTTQSLSPNSILEPQSRHNGNIRATAASGSQCHETPRSRRFGTRQPVRIHGLPHQSVGC